MINKKFNILENILNSVYYLFVVIIMLITILFLCLNLSNRYFPHSHFNLFGYNYMKIVSSSMETAISKNDFVIIQEKKEYEVNDIVTFYDDKERVYITHRIVFIEENYLITKGDANGVVDPAINKEQIIGKVIAINKIINKRDVLIKDKVFILSIIFVIISSIGLLYLVVFIDTDNE